MDRIERISELFGVETGYWDIFGKRHRASEEVLTAILASLGADSENAVAERRGREWQRPLPPTLVVSQADGSFALSVPESLAEAVVSVSIEWEDGGRSKSEIPLADWPITETAVLDNARFVRKAVSLGGGLPLGYHCMHVAIRCGPTAQARLIVCPERAYQPDWLQTGKGAGIAVSLYGLRSGRNWGCGDTTDLRHLIDWAADEARAGFIALNPLHAISNRQPYNTSPYLPNSIFYRNHIYLDIESVQDFETSERARIIFGGAKARAAAAELRDAEFVEYERVSRLKYRFLKLLFREFLIREYRKDTGRAKAFKAYMEREGELLHLFAVHSALDEAMHKKDPEVWNWHAWPKEFQDPDSHATRAFAEKRWRSVLLHKYIQWQLDVQFEQAQAYAKNRGLKIGLYHDLALATDRFGSDLWAHGPFYASGCRVGSPPDNFSPNGQDWAFPPPNSERHFEDGYRLFAESIRKASAHGGALRIDHVMRFFRLYWIPDGKDATQGTYVLDRYRDLARVLALESVRGQFIVIGEDLGTVPDLVRDTLKEFGILGYRLFYFERDESRRFKRPDAYPRQALVSVSTHDLPTLAGFWTNADIDARRIAGMIGDGDAYNRAIQERAGEKRKILDLLRELKLLPDWFPEDARQVPELTGELHNAVIGFLASTPSQLLAISQEDLFKDTEQQNLPGTTAEHPNWRHKMKIAIEDLSGEAARGYTRMLRAWLEKTGRADFAG